ncbi:hypothetical protein HPB48_021364 [Haemaphysalis longicornis]|uniref:Reverse transcriptase domain-containing protein n=1 Tax=Haemaphysalis longicornis TaxID=44386 RepID=A0A9J6GU05_HAELO|nr:hypothetical protein HPB48_021364 [Haemaphysalis longicornis]
MKAADMMRAHRTPSPAAAADPVENTWQQVIAKAHTGAAALSLRPCHPKVLDTVHVQACSPGWGRSAHGSDQAAYAEATLLTPLRARLRRRPPAFVELGPGARTAGRFRICGRPLQPGRTSTKGAQEGGRADTTKLRRVRPSRSRFVGSLLLSRSASIHTGKKRVRDLVPERGVPRGSMLSPVLFNVTTFPLSWKVAEIPHAFFLVYANDVAVGSVDDELPRQKAGLQAALDITSSWCSIDGLDLSPTKATYVSIADRISRRRLSQIPIWLSFNCEPMDTAAHIRVPWLKISAAGSEASRVRSIQ